jgi:hypothetical protein
MLWTTRLRRKPPSTGPYSSSSLHSPTFGDVWSSRKIQGSWNLGSSVPTWMAYFHVPEESVSDAVDVLHPTVQERTSVLVEHALVNLNQDTPVWVGTEGLGFDKRVYEVPLSRGILS